MMCRGRTQANRQNAAIPVYIAALVLLVCFFEKKSQAFSLRPILDVARQRKRPSACCGGILRATADDNKDKIMIALTREDGKNDKMAKALSGRDGLEAVELPCIAHADGPDYSTLAARLQENCWDYVIITSPEAARVVTSAWHVVKDNPPPVAAVGKATESTLKENGIEVVFTPSKATAVTLAKELPAGSEHTKVMYPASAKAKDTLQKGLASRGFEVVRLNTYDTVAADWTDAQKATAAGCKIACFASPSSVKGWLKNTKKDDDDTTTTTTSVLAACIGETSATACRDLGWKEENIFYPEYPGIEGWVDAVQEAVDSLAVTSTN